ncbi:S-layer homology domain-containing protein [Acetivibrio saccincola]|uniref:S-layer homology domain-containing protein n=1 Tax=Acetivibrio saccincola TaxID=1677857 RepID=UPI0016A811A7|nr:S-layer homology domain-containing protein [Acetivibrio saccincola]NLW28169.1 S-layer homology domain-containing protein [Acetivibrio saccincola]
MERKLFKGILSLAVVLAILMTFLTTGIFALSAKDGIESIINKAQNSSLEERDEFVYGLTQSELDVLRSEVKKFTKGQKNSLLQKLNRNDDFDVLMRNILLADEEIQLVLEDVIYKLENRVKSDLEKFAKEAVFLTSVEEKSRDVIRFIVNDLIKVNEDTYLEYVENVKNLFLGMSEEELKSAFLEFSDLEESQREGVPTIIMILNQEDFDVDLSGFQSIAHDMNKMIMNCEYDSLGTKMLLKMLEYFSNIGATSVVHDKDGDVYKVKLSLDIPSNIRNAIDRELRTTAILGKDIKTLDDLLIEIEELINKHDNTEIYNFKKLLKEEFKMVYRGNLPVPETGDPGSDPKDPLPSKDPSDENEDEGTTGDDKGDKNDDKSPNVTPKPEEVEESDDKLPGTVTFTDIENHWAEENIIGLAKLGIVTGYTDGSIKPNNNITRAEMAVIVVKAASLEPADEINLSFKDKDEIPNWAAGYIQTAVDNGIITGYEDNTFKPSKNLTREEMVVLIIKAFDIAVEEGLQPPKFKDTDEIGSWALNFVAKSVDLNIVSGYLDNTFKPKRNVTRAETFTVLYNILKTK